MAHEAPLQIYDTLRGEKRRLTLLEAGKCSLYVCGPTVYDMSHIGHARSALAMDLLVRYLRHRGVDVRYVRNITDVDDKIIARANELGVPSTDVSVRFTDEYHRDLDALGLIRPDIEPKVTEHIPHIVAIVERLIAKDLAYAVDGDVYYRVARFEPYGQLSGRSLDEMQAGARVEVDTRKENPMDFALWKAAKPGEPAWDSPWGQGRPGWHIECSAMSMEHLGETFDIHGGGRDLIFPHHENELAQSQGACGHETFARHWVHNGFVNFAGEKMSKSLGNFFTIREVLELYHPEVLRYFLCAVQYRSGVNFDVEVPCPSCGAVMSPEAQASAKCDACGHGSSAEELRQRVRFPGLEDADDRVAYVYDTLRRCEGFIDENPQVPDGAEAPELVRNMLPAVIAAMEDDLNTAAAISALSEPLSELNRLLDLPKKKVDPVARIAAVHVFMSGIADTCAMTGLFGRPVGPFLVERREIKARRLGIRVADIEAKIQARQDARAAKDWESADRARDELMSIGVTIRDGVTGTDWTL